MNIKTRYTAYWTTRTASEISYTVCVTLSAQDVGIWLLGFLHREVKVHPGGVKYRFEALSVALAKLTLKYFRYGLDFFHVGSFITMKKEMELPNHFLQSHCCEDVPFVLAKPLHEYSIHIFFSNTVDLSIQTHIYVWSDRLKCARVYVGAIV